MSPHQRHRFSGTLMGWWLSCKILHPLPDSDLIGVDERLRFESLSVSASRRMTLWRNGEAPESIEHSGMHIEEVVSFIRPYQNEELLVLHNLSDVELTVELEN